ncbi:MAG: carboxypeptidase-like regulatory domain-containing protein [Bacteroidota bacterium]|nr:carboxypeptidase-like regulatory domain-containing protein [Bacteroidota bacterium]
MQTEAGALLPGATVFFKGTYTGASTNEEGQFGVRGDFAKGVLTLSVSFIGYETQELPISGPDNALVITLRPSAVLDQVVVAASRVEESIGQVPVTVEKLDQRQVEQLTTPDLTAGLARFKANDFVAKNFDATSPLIEPANNPAGSNLGYDAVSRYGYIGNTFPASPTAPPPAMPSTPLPASP